jgi:hypothetical protein
MRNKNSLRSAGIAGQGALEKFLVFPRGDFSAKHAALHDRQLVVRGNHAAFPVQVAGG